MSGLARPLEGVRRRLRPLHRRIAGRLPLKLRRRYLYFAGHRRLVSLRHPRLFTEKINWRIVHDRRPILSWTCDKIAMQEYATESAGQLGLNIPEMLWSGCDVRQIIGARFDRDWVLKPNHRSGLIEFFVPNQRVESTMQAKLSNWMRDDQGVLLGEWAYSKARRRYLAEYNIQPGADLPDYKFFVFHGKVQAIQLDQQRFSGHTRAFYTRDWDHMVIRNRFPVSAPVDPPYELGKMCEIAEKLGEPFDFMRVDLYLAGGEIWFGELTPYPGGGVEPFIPRSFDRWLGQFWNLPPNHEVRGPNT